MILTILCSCGFRFTGRVGRKKLNDYLDLFARGHPREKHVLTPLIWATVDLPPEREIEMLHREPGPVHQAPLQV